MKRKNKKSCWCLLLLVYSFGYGQMNQFSYKRSLTAGTDQWNKIILPNEIFAKLSPDLSDLRIFGITKANDTLMAPYILQEASTTSSGKEVTGKIINQSHSGKENYFTIEIPAENTINQVELTFKQQNFDWRIQLEASQDQQQWFTVLNNYRILSISNHLTHYLFTTLSFPDSKYHYYRLSVNTADEPVLLAAKITQQQIVAGVFNKYAIATNTTRQDRQRRQTIIDLALPMSLPVSYIKINVHDKIDYYRPLIVQYPSDSFKTQNGWQYSYSMLGSATLNSLEKNELYCNSTRVKKLQVVIDNQDNEPLKIDSLEVKGYQYALIARFTEPGSYYLVYGNSRASKPDYDISRFADKIPPAINTLVLGEEALIPKEQPKRSAPLFQSKQWLWGIMVLIIAVLGWFTVRMMKKG